jgi:hypothetical protein
MKPDTIKSHVQVFGSLAETDQNPTLFRYMKLSTLLLLLEGKAFFPSVSSLSKNDPFEGKLFCEDAWLMTELSALRGQDTEGKLDRWLLEHASGWEKKSIESPETSASFRSQLLSEIYARELKERRAAWCWFQDDLESAAMWSVYGHKGVAVRTNLNALKSALPSTRPFQLARMRYVDHRPSSENAFDAERNDRHLILRPHLLKAIEYQHENELRVVTECPAKCGGVVVEQIGWRALIEGVIISPLLPAQEAAAVKAMLEKFPWQKSVSIERSNLLPDNSMHTHDGSYEAFRSDRGCYEPGLPNLIAEL